MKGPKNIVLLLLVLLSAAGFSKEIQIKGTIKGTKGGVYANKFVKVLIIEDFITNTKKVIAKSKTDQHGNFKIKFNSEQTHFTFLEFDQVERNLYTEPGKSYYINVKAPLKELDKSHGFFAKDVRRAIIVNQQKTGINNLIDSLELLSSNFLYNHPQQRRAYKPVKAFTDSLENNFKNIQDPFFKKYLTYKVGELKMYVMRQFRKDFAKQYIDNSAGICDHIQSMHVFNSFFQGHMKNGIQIQDKSPFHTYILRGDLDRMLTEVYKTDKFNRELNELVLLKGLFEISNSYFYRKSRLNITLDKIIASTAYPLHKTIARNIKGKLNHLEVGYPAPAISIDGSDQSFNLSEHKGKYVYLSFFKGWDENFKKEVEIINYLKERYKDELVVICIGTDISTDTYKQFVDQQEDKSIFIHYNYSTQLLSDYKIEDFRIDKGTAKTAKHMLIGPQGSIIYSEAKAPTRGFEYDLRKIIIQ